MEMEKIKIFDECLGYGVISNLGTFTDATVVKRGNQWWMFASGFDKDLEDLNIFSASLPPDACLSAVGWTIATDPANKSNALPVEAAATSA